MTKPSLYIHLGQAKHFLKWEIPEFKKYFKLVDSPSPKVPLLSFGPDVLEESSNLPAILRFAVLFPGFGHNPLYNLNTQRLHQELISNYFDTVFINPGPLQLAYKRLNNVELYPFSVDTKTVKLNKYRNTISSLIHVSNDGLQKDWQRSEKIMKLTGFKYDVYPPRDPIFYKKQIGINNLKNNARKIMFIKQKEYLPYGYVNHNLIIKKYQQYDGFVHVAKDIKHPGLIDGKYTASLIEAGLTGSILFWHDTFNLGNNLETVFNLPLEPKKAAESIIRISSSIDVKKHSALTRQEMLDTFNPAKSVKIRSDFIYAKLNY